MGPMDKQQLVHRLTTGRVSADGDYLGNLAHWQRHFPERQIMVGFFDEIMAEPEPFLRRVYRFLEVDDAAKYVPADVRRARNARPNRGRIREDIHYPLAAAYLPRLEQLDHQFSNPSTAAWLACAHRWLK